jgi:TrmH family RNA methyltransferase
MAQVEKLTSFENPLLKDVRKAVAKGGLTADGCCIAETFHLLDEALRSGCEVKVVLAAASAQAAVETRLISHPNLRLIVLPDALSARVSATDTGQGVLALVRPPVWAFDDLFGARSLLVILDGLQDPGNAGAIIRAAEAFESSGVVFLKGTVNPYNPKVVRASTGSVFRLPMLLGVDTATLGPELDRRKVTVYAADAAGGLAAARADLTVGCAIVVGSEGHGIMDDHFAAADRVHVPTAGVESLNAAMAAGILLYEARRQRGGRP